MKISFWVNLTLAIMTLCGCTLPSGVPQTPEILELQQKAYVGDLESQYQLGLHYTLNGRWYGDYNRGYNWFLYAAERGHVESLYMAGMGKLLGKGTNIDLERATQLFVPAAEAGHPRAQYQVGMAYLNGTGVVKDKVWGRQWLEQAAINGHGGGQFVLGALFAKGVGGNANLPEAWHWLRRAELGGHAKAAVALEQLEKRMSKSEINLGEKILIYSELKTAGLNNKPRIRYLQTVLNSMGFSAGSEDGIIGPKTRKAVAKYLRNNKLPLETPTAELIKALQHR